MKIQIPDQLKSAVPQTLFGRVLAATPVIMAVVATLLAGLASSEMTKAQYQRALAAQQQSKAGDQWSFFQAKRMRGAFQSNTAELMQSLTPVRPVGPAALTAWAQGQPGLSQRLESPQGQQAMKYLEHGQVPPIPAGVALDPKIQAALRGVETMAPDTEMEKLMAPVSNQMLDQALVAAGDRVEAFDRETSPVNAVIDHIYSLLRQSSGAGGGSASGPSLVRDFAVARMRYTAVRYEAEARLNQAIANIYELQVRKSNFEAQRHLERSQRFFFGMLAAQLGVIVATLAMAARQRNLLWSLAAFAGLLAVAFAIYVYLYV